MQGQGAKKVFVQRQKTFIYNYVPQKKNQNKKKNEHTNKQTNKSCKGKTAQWSTPYVSLTT